MSKKKLQINCPECEISKGIFKPYDFTYRKNKITYHIKFLRVSKNNILSINSKFIWEIKTGKPNGINFKTTSTKLLDMKSFSELSNKIVVLRGNPYKILKYINESEVIDISETEGVNDITIFRNIDDIHV